MVNLFNINNYKIDTSDFSNFLNDEIVVKFEKDFANYVGAKYACSLNSATSAIFLVLKLYVSCNFIIDIPSMIPPVVPNAIINSGNCIRFKDDVDWVGDSYVLFEGCNLKIIDSAQKVEKNQFKKEADYNDLMIFSFYPTKPVGSCDGGMIVSDSSTKIHYLKEACMNGMTYMSMDSWINEVRFPGWKMYMNSIQAYIASKNLLKLDSKKKKLKEIAGIYNKELNCDNTSHHLYRIEVANNRKFIEKMKSVGINCGIHYRALHDNPIYTNRFNRIPCSKSEKVSKRTVSIPFHEKLSYGDIARVIDNIRKFR